MSAPTASDAVPLWEPGPDRVARAHLTAFMRWLRDTSVVPAAGAPDDYPSLYAWSLREPEAFWSAVWRFCGVVAEERAGGEPWDVVGIGLDRMAPPDSERGPRWFPGARLNFAENLLRYRDHRQALVAWTERGAGKTLSYAALYAEVARCAGALRRAGVGSGDRVAGFMPNVPETVIAMLAAASLGAIWSSCSPDFGARGVLDRFGQIEPKVLICADGYQYAGRRIDIRERVREIVVALPALESVVMVHTLDAPASVGSIPRAVSWDAFLSSGDGAPLTFAQLPFDHPLYIMYSSGTTGLPKCMVHGAGGTLLQHLKEYVLHYDLRRDDRMFYFTTCGWMMWNFLVSALAVGATVVLYDGAPMHPAKDVLWEMAERERLTVFGTSAKYLALAEKEGVAPHTRELGALRMILSTGSPLASHSYDYVYSRVKRDVHLASVSGGTDLISCFALGSPIDPVWRGELQRRGLGMAVDVWDSDGRPLLEATGELVCTQPFPSMPVRFWNDPGGHKYRSAYFDFFPGVWRHGDWAMRTRHDGLIIHGRSDATLNPGGVRIGTAEIYRQVEQLPEIMESLAIGQEIGGGDVRVVLFVRLREGLGLDEPLRERIRARIREHASPHHVPRRIVQVADIPRTISGKISEIAVRDVVHGRAVMNTDALANPGALELFRDLPELRD